MRFPYLPFTVAATVAYRPYIPIRIIGPMGTARLDGLLDTGADQTILPRAIAESLGVEIEAGAQARFRGVGGQIVTGAYGRVELEVRARSQRIRWPVTAAFLDGTTTAILGHIGFLQYFTASFNGQRHFVTLTPNSTLQTQPAP